jgi:cytochrome b
VLLALTVGHAGDVGLGSSIRSGQSSHLSLGAVVVVAVLVVLSAAVSATLGPHRRRCCAVRLEKVLEEGCG